MYRVSRLWLSSLAAVTLLLVAGPKQPPAQSAPTTRVAAAPTTTPGHPEASEGNWGCLYEGEGGVYWLGAAAGAQPIKVLELEGEDNSVDDFAISADGARLATSPARGSARSSSSPPGSGHRSGAPTRTPGRWPGRPMATRWRMCRAGF
jgi:hypothetical protein